MNAALPVLLLIFVSLTLWLLTESSVRWYLKASCIAAFCVFTVVFWSAIHSYLGWPANENDMPEKVLIHWVIVKEPNKQTKSDGAIYFLVESVSGEEDSWLDFFDYRSSRVEPRLFQVSYSRELHEQIENQMRGKLRSGQPVLGKLSKLKGNGRKGKEKGKEKGDGSESQNQEWQFHPLRPSDFLNKPEN
jgi:hypothetical protein